MFREVLAKERRGARLWLQQREIPEYRRADGHENEAGLLQVSCRTWLDQGYAGAAGDEGADAMLGANLETDIGLYAGRFHRPVEYHAIGCIGNRGDKGLVRQLGQLHHLATGEAVADRQGAQCMMPTQRAYKDIRLRYRQDDEADIVPGFGDPVGNPR